MWHCEYTPAPNLLPLYSTLHSQTLPALIFLLPVHARRLALIHYLLISFRRPRATPLWPHTHSTLAPHSPHARSADCTLLRPYPALLPTSHNNHNNNIKCTQNNFLSTSDELCAFCYPVGKKKASCTSVTVANYHDPCGKPADASSPPYQYSYGIAGECDCATGIAQTGQCAACANAKHPGCVWVESGTQDITVDVGPAAFHATFTVSRWTNQTCKSTNTLIESKLYSVTNSLGTQLLGMKFKDTNTEWYWEQCTIPGIWFAVVAFGALLAALVVACACLCCCIRRMRGNGGGTQYSTNTYYVSN